MLISIRDYAICDGTISGGFAATDFRLRVTRTIDTGIALRTATPFTYDRGIRTADLSFTVQRVHADVDTAEIYELKEEATIPESGNVIIASSNGVVQAYLLDGRLIDHHQIFQIGAASFHSYHIVGGLFVLGIAPGPTPARPTTLNEVIATGITIGLWPVPGVDTPTTLTEVIDAGTTLGLWPSVPVPDTPTTLNEVIAAGTALELWL